MVQKSAQDSLGPTRSFSGELTLNQSETQGMHFPSLESGGWEVQGEGRALWHEGKVPEVV